jgi:hypothetical protein
MNSPLRALLILAPIVGLVGVVFLSSRSPKPVAAGPEQESSAGEEPHAAPPEPSHAPAAPVALRPPPLAASSAVESPTEESLALAMHALEDSAPERALELARRGQALWPAGPRAPEFAATEVKCLYRLGRPSEGRGAAEAMVNKYPRSQWALEVEKQTGAHPYVDH